MTLSSAAPVSERSRLIAERVEAFVRGVVMPFEGDPRCTSHGPSEDLVRELRDKAREAGVMTPQLSARVMEEIVLPTVRAMKAMGSPYKGILYAGLMITAEGPKLIEYNVRFGDPECQVLMLRLMSDLLPALMAATDGMLRNFDLRWFHEAALTVVMAAKGYPGSYAQGSVIDGLDAAAAVDRIEGRSDDL